MSNEYNGQAWTDLSSNITPTQDQLFQRWSIHEQRWGETGTPGITKTKTSITSVATFGHTNPVEGIVYLYRNEEGLLLCVYVYYIHNNQPKPWMLDVHPDYQRQGVATMVVNESLVDFGGNYDFENQLRDLDITISSANFANKFIKNIYNQ
jgi:GNAT superfamily N-acetyltransferase